jgi:cytoskeletal protein CcmA (bactofilin family)
MGLFAKDKAAGASASAAGRDGDHETSFFGAKLTVKGRVSGGGSLIVMGTLEGEFDLNGELVIAPSASVNGDVRAVSVAVSGGFSGSLTARQRIHLEKSAVVNGRLAAPKLSMVEGAVLNGEVEMEKPSESKPAPNAPGRKEKK